MKSEQLKRAVRESHRAQFAGVDYQKAAHDALPDTGDVSDDELGEIESSPDPGCDCGFCSTAPWQDIAPWNAIARAEGKE